MLHYFLLHYFDIKSFYVALFNGKPFDITLY